MGGDLTGFFSNSSETSRGESPKNRFIVENKQNKIFGDTQSEAFDKWPMHSSLIIF